MSNDINIEFSEDTNDSVYRFLKLWEEIVETEEKDSNHYVVIRNYDMIDMLDKLSMLNFEEDEPVIEIIVDTDGRLTVK